MSTKRGDPPPQLTIDVESKVIVQKHRRSLAARGRWVPLSLPPSVGQRGRPRVAGGERNTTPRQRKGGWESTEWVSEWVEKEKVCAGERRTRVGTFVRFWSAAVLTVGEEEEDDAEEDSTMRHRLNRRDEILDSSHSVAPAPTDGSTTPLNFDLRHSDPGDWILPPPPRGSGQLFASGDPCWKTNTPAHTRQKFLRGRRWVEREGSASWESWWGFRAEKSALVFGSGPF